VARVEALVTVRTRAHPRRPTVPHRGLGEVFLNNLAQVPPAADIRAGQSVVLIGRTPGYRAVWSVRGRFLPA
jgi:hypothetical protein